MNFHKTKGNYHALFLTNDGNVYSCGYNYDGQLGHGTKEKKCLPKMVTFKYNNVKIEKIKCGYLHSLCIDKFGRLFGWGYNKHKQLGGYNSNDDTIYQPCLIEEMINETIIDCDGGYMHSIVLTNNGKLYYFGNEKS